MAWTRKEHMEHARLLRQQAAGFYDVAVKARGKGHEAKVDRAMARGIEKDVSATRHERRARSVGTGAITGKPMDKVDAAWASIRRDADKQDAAVAMPCWDAGADDGADDLPIDPATGKAYRPGSIDDPAVQIAAAQESRAGREAIFGRFC